MISYFITLAKENQQLDILDARVPKEVTKEDIEGMIEIATRCFRLNGKRRPRMKQVSIELEGLRRSQRCLKVCKGEISFAESSPFSLQLESEE